MITRKIKKYFPAWLQIFPRCRWVSLIFPFWIMICSLSLWNSFRKNVLRYRSARRSLGNLITTWTMFAPSYFIRFLCLFCFALFFYLIRWLCNQLWHMRRQNNTANEKKQLVTPCDEKGRAFRNIGQNNTYFFHCLISFPFLICI